MNNLSCLLTFINIYTCTLVKIVYKSSAAIIYLCRPMYGLACKRNDRICFVYHVNDVIIITMFVFISLLTNTLIYQVNIPSASFIY
jgi:hypothetical protein